MPGSVDRMRSHFWLQSVRASLHIATVALFRAEVPYAESRSTVKSTIRAPYVAVTVSLPQHCRIVKSRRTTYRRTIEALAAEISAMSGNCAVRVMFSFYNGSSVLSYEHQP